MDEAETGTIAGDGNKECGPLGLVPVEVLVSVGKARPSVAELLALKSDSVLPLEQSVSDPVELYVGSRLIARGELLEQDGDEGGRLAVRLTEVAPAKDEF